MPLPSTGSLDPGTYFIPEGPLSPGRFTFTVPAGWATDGGWVTKNLDDEPLLPNSVTNNVLLVTYFVTHVYMDICNWEGTMVDVGTTVVELTRALLAQEGRISSGATDRRAGRLSGPAGRVDRPGRPRLCFMRQRNHPVLAGPRPERVWRRVLCPRRYDRCCVRRRRRRQHLRGRCTAHGGLLRTGSG